MTRSKFRWVAALASVFILAGTAGLGLQAQDRPKAARGGLVKAKGKEAEPTPERSSTLPQQAAKMSVQEALLRPFDLPFDEPTTLADVAEHLRRTLGAAVVLDLGALARHDLTPYDTVELDLKGVRLKTGLKLLLDQVGLAYRVEPEDNILVLTDHKESDDRYQQILEEVKALHNEMHAVQDSLEELLSLEEAETLEGGSILRVGRPQRTLGRADRTAYRRKSD